MNHVRVLLSVALLAACGSEPGRTGTPVVDAVDVVPDIAPPNIDAPNAIGLPTWMLEDIQPASPRVGQTYGLATFNGKIIVVSLLEGF
jgi:hypothetical protein